MNVFNRPLRLALCVLSALSLSPCYSQIIPGAEQSERYLPLLEHKKIAVVVNPSSRVGERHLVDFLSEQSLTIDTIFAPEHGFRSFADAGEAINDSIDETTQLPVLSLYGKRQQPPGEIMQRIDVLVFDIQDVGTRFFTYVSTLHYAIEACADAGKTLLILDRPNPNGDYIAGPVLDLSLRSFVGMHPIPVVYGLTLGELAHMIVGEGWLQSKGHCDLRVIKNLHYRHADRYEPPVPPSPNLRSWHAIRWYPSLVFFEATPYSVGRGTPFPFQVIGAAEKSAGSFQFIPVSQPGAKQPPLLNQIVYGEDLREREPPKFSLQPLLRWRAYSTRQQQVLFNAPLFMDKLIGVKKLREMIESGAEEHALRAVWQGALDQYLIRRQRYLLYPD